MGAISRAVAACASKFTLCDEERTSPGRDFNERARTVRDEPTVLYVIIIIIIIYIHIHTMLYRRARASARVIDSYGCTRISRANCLKLIRYNTNNNRNNI